MVENDKPVEGHRIEFIDTEGIPVTPIPEELHRYTIEKLQEECRKKVKRVTKAAVIFGLLCLAGASVSPILYFDALNKNKKVNSAKVEELQRKLNSEKNKSNILRAEFQRERRLRQRESTRKEFFFEEYIKLVRKVIHCENFSDDPEIDNKNPKRRNIADY